MSDPNDSAMQVWRDFRGRGWSFPVEPAGEVTAAEGQDKIRQAIWLILSTAPGERVMRPDFGCGIHDLVFAVNDAATTGRVESLVREALMHWEPRIEIRHVTANPDPRQSACLRIEIEYQVRATDDRFNLVYPFYLE